MLFTLAITIIILFYHYKISGEFKSSPGELVLIHGIFISNSELTDTGIIYKKRFLFYWFLWVLSFIIIETIGDRPRFSMESSSVRVIPFLG